MILLTPPSQINQDRPTSHEVAVPVMNPVMDLPHIHDWWSIHAKDLQSICQLGVNFFFDSLGVVHLPLLGVRPGEARPTFL